MKQKCNGGVCCNVDDCIHNVNGCDCNKGKIEVSRGDSHSADTKHLFCKSYACKNDCNCKTR